MKLSIMNDDVQKRNLELLSGYSGSLYRYMSSNRNPNEICFSRADHFIDPFENAVALDIKTVPRDQIFGALEQFVREYSPDWSVTQLAEVEKAIDQGKHLEIQLDQEGREIAKSILSSKVRIACFTKSGWDNQILWEKSASNYSGICVEYDTRLLAKEFERYSMAGIGFAQFPVNYVTALTDFSYVELAEFEMNDLSKILGRKLKAYTFEDEIRYALATDSVIEDDKIVLPTSSIISITVGTNFVGNQLDISDRQSEIGTYRLVPNLATGSFERVPIHR